ncbi:hypothetical protein [Mesorhizobium sp.]|uniref:hypothetical protein n=1 Tax=Mesorhizobium sp. TaxID=1871066 RepID=UPI000FE487D5|nr:hypothetical protein [Mesorhizobium sp.]RWG25803.1 MAG: hypothetical protein EOQ60_28855 [Mesorhizobium sp.]
MVVSILVTSIGVTGQTITATRRAMPKRESKPHKFHSLQASGIASIGIAIGISADRSRSPPAKPIGAAMPEPRQIEQIAEPIIKQARQRQSKAALNNAIMLMAHDFTMAEVVQILRAHADQIEDYG